MKTLCKYVRLNGQYLYFAILLYHTVKVNCLVHIIIHEHYMYRLMKCNSLSVYLYPRPFTFLITLVFKEHHWTALADSGLVYSIPFRRTKVAVFTDIVSFFNSHRAEQKKKERKKKKKKTTFNTTAIIPCITSNLRFLLHLSWSSILVGLASAN